MKRFMVLFAVFFLGPVSKLSQPYQTRRKKNHGRKGNSKFFISCRDSTALFDFAEEIFHKVTFLV